MESIDKRRPFTSVGRILMGIISSSTEMGLTRLQFKKFVNIRLAFLLTR